MQSVSVSTSTEERPRVSLTTPNSMCMYHAQPSGEKTDLLTALTYNTGELRSGVRPGSPPHLPDIREGDHADHKQERPEVRDLLRQHFVLSEPEHVPAVFFVSLVLVPTCWPQYSGLRRSNREHWTLEETLMLQSGSFTWFLVCSCAVMTSLLKWVKWILSTQ